MENVYELLLNSFLASLLVPLESEVVWASHLYFKQDTILSATFLALVASMAAYVVNYGLGWLLSLDRENIPIDDTAYERGQRLSRRYFVWVMLIQWIPFLGAFSFIMAFFRPGFWRFCLAVFLGRIIYYGVALQQAGLLS